MTVNHSNPLKGLRGLHLPPPVSAWPPAPGWWILGLLVLSMLILAFWLWRRHRRRAFRRAALQQLKQLRTAADAGQAGTRILADLSILLRRVAISCYGRQQVAGLHGNDWLAFLDRTGRTAAFTQQGRALLDAPYRHQASQDAAPLLDLAQQWLKVQS